MDSYEKWRLEEIRKAHEQRKQSVKSAKSSQSLLLIGSIVLVAIIAWFGKSMFLNDVAPAEIQPQSVRKWKAPESITLSKDVIAKKKLDEKNSINLKTTEKKYTTDNEAVTPEMITKMRKRIIAESDEEIEFYESNLKQNGVQNDASSKTQTQALLKKALEQRKWYDKIDPNDRKTWEYFEK